MRIVIASDLHWPTINGIATFGRNLARGLADAGHEVVVVAPSPTGRRYEEIDGNHRVLRTRSIEFPLYQHLRISLPPIREFRRLVKDFRPDLVHVQTPLGEGMAAVSVAKRRGIALVGTNHSMSENFIDNIKLPRLLVRPVDRFLRGFGTRFYSNFSHVTLPTQAALDMQKPEAFTKPTSAISNGIDLERFHPAEPPAGFRQRFEVPDEVPVVLYVGRVDAEKHLHVLLEAAKRMLEEDTFHLVIVGFGVDGDRLERLTDELGIREHVTFTGRIEEEDKPDFFRIATVFAMPSPAELQSISTLEAMASGLPVVAVDAGALGELCVDGLNGLRFPFDDAEAMASGLTRILRDPELAGRMGSASLEIAARHDLRETIRRYVALYEQVVADHAVERALSARAVSRGIRLWPARLRAESQEAPGDPLSE